MSLASQLRASEWSDFEATWAQLMSGSDPIDPALAAIDVAGERKQLTRVLPLVREYSDVLEAAGRTQEAARLLGRALLAGGPPGELSVRLFRTAEAGWASEPWWEEYARLADFHEATADVRRAWKALSQLIELGEGTVVFHRSGWGAGQVTELELKKLEVRVKFLSGRRDWFPIKSIIETCEVLDPLDLRSMLVREPDELQRLLREEPLEVLSRVVRRYGDRVKISVLKSAMSQIQIEGPTFNSWWRKARKAAETSTHVEVTGTGNNSLVRLLEEAADPAESMKRQLRLSKNLGAALTRVRDLSTGEGLSDELKEAAFSSLETLAEAEDEEESSRLSAWLLLRSGRGVTPEPLRERLAAAAAAEAPEDPAEPGELWKMFAKFPGARDQEAAIDLLRELHPEDAWIDEAANNLFHAPPGMVRALADALLTAERHEVLSKTYMALLIRPTRNPTLFVALAEQAESGKLKGKFPADLQRLHSFLLLAQHLAEQAGADVFRTRATTRLVSLLTGGEPPLLQSLLEGAKRGEVKNFMPMISKGVDGAIDRTFTHIAVSMYPDIFRDGSRPFWEEENTTWTSRSGLAKREAELRDLREVKIPANSEAIGKAASYGDLSENSEWEAAMEEQRNLTARAMQIEEELGKAHLIEDAMIPQGVVAPGTVVKYREVDSGEEREVRIMGPWDSEADNDISYRSPVAQGMLGNREGSRATLTLPGGTKEVEVVAVELVALK